MVVMEKIELLTTREKQAFAALCLAKFCAVHKINHNFISDLIEHLLSILISHSLSDWEDKGTSLEITGRGDPLPESLNSIIPPNLYNTFNHLVECVVEVGIVDMYGDTTDEPLNFLHECIKVLELSGIIPPDLNDIFSVQQAEAKPENAWGAPISKVEFEKVQKKCKDIQLKEP